MSTGAPMGGGVITGRDGVGNPIVTYYASGPIAPAGGWINVWDYWQDTDAWPVLDHAPMFRRAYAAGLTRYPQGFQLYVPAAVYQFQAPVILAADNIQIRGDGYGTQLTPGAALTSGPLLWYQGTRSGICLTDLYFNLLGVPGVTAWQFDNVTNPQLLHVRVRNTTQPVDYVSGGGGTLPFSVMDYGAAGDGTTDDTAAVQAAINAAHAAGGGHVYLPPGVYVCSTLTLFSDIVLRGAGITISTLQLKAGANADLINGGASNVALINLAAVAGSGSNGGLSNFLLLDLTLDGNKANQTGGPSWCLRLYGYGYVLDNVRVHDGYSGGVQSDWNGNSGSTLLPDAMEAQWSNVKIHDCGGPGLQIGGPHDSQFTNLIIYSCVNTAYTGTGSLTPALHLAPNAAGCLFTQLHCWNSNLAILAEAQASFVNSIAEGSIRGSNNPTCIAVLGGPLTWTGGMIFGAAGSTAATTGVQIGQTAGATPLSPYIVQQSGGLTTLVSITSLTMSGVYMFECQVAFFNILADGGRNYLDGLLYASAGNAAYVIGAFNTNFANPTETNLVLRGLTSGTARYLGGNLTVTGQINVAGVSGLRFTTNRADPANDVVVRQVRSSTANTLDTVMDTAGARWVQNNGAAYNVMARLDPNGNYSLAGALAVGQSASAAAVASGGTITTSNVGLARVNPAANVTGIILQAGTVAGQRVMVVNESAFTLTFAVGGTSHVADGTSDVIAATTAREYVWDSGTSLWYRLA